MVDVADVYGWCVRLVCVVLLMCVGSVVDVVGVCGWCVYLLCAMV